MLKTVMVSSSTQGEPITKEELKLHLRIEAGETAEDDYLDSLIRVARDRVEEITNRRLMPQTWRVYLDNWPGEDYISLPYAPLRGVGSTGIVYTNSDNDSTTFSSTGWGASTNVEPGRIYLEYDEDWPSPTLDNKDPIAIDFNCGYSTRAAVPEVFKQAMKIICSEYYEFREPVVMGSIAPVPNLVTSLLQSHRVWAF